MHVTLQAQAEPHSPSASLLSTVTFVKMQKIGLSAKEKLGLSNWLMSLTELPPLASSHSSNSFASKNLAGW
jgi:hypothetical protein